jgi:hypothetical protein
MAHVFQINCSGGGVPKVACHEAEVNQLGLVADDQADKKHHGGPERALSLYSLEHILTLQGEGHPIFPGSTGENLTVSGLDWAQIVPGARLQIGEGETAVHLTITSFAPPAARSGTPFRMKNSNGSVKKSTPAGPAPTPASIRGANCAPALRSS